MIVHQKYLYNIHPKITLMVKVSFTMHAEDMLRERKFTKERNHTQ